MIDNQLISSLFLAWISGKLLFYLQIISLFVNKW
jgi:hypothetical protein